MDLRGKKLFGSKRKDAEASGKDTVNEMLDAYEERYEIFCLPAFCKNNLARNQDWSGLHVWGCYFQGFPGECKII